MSASDQHLLAAVETWLARASTSKRERGIARLLRRAVAALRRPAALDPDVAYQRKIDRVLAVRAARKRRGLCATCGKVPPTSGRASCERCLGYWRRRRKARHA